MPFALSVVAPIVPVLVPPENEKTTVAPPVVIAFPAASFASSVSVPPTPDATVSFDTVTTDVAAEMPPGVTVIVGGAVPTGAAFTVAPIVVAVPTVTPVNVAV